MNIKKIKLFLFGLTKTIYVNLHYFPFLTAIKLPILLTNKVRIKKLKGKVIINTSKIKRGMINIGYQHVSINDVNEYSLWNVEGTIIFNGSAGFGAGTKIAVGKLATLTLGYNFSITARSEIACFKAITFGDNVLISWNVLIMDTDAHQIVNEKGVQINLDKPILIGNKVWIGCRSLILKGTEIKNNCVVGANSLINKSFNETHVTIAGNPARIIKKNVEW